MVADEDDDDLLVDLSQHGFEFQASQTGRPSQSQAWRGDKSPASVLEEEQDVVVEDGRCAAGEEVVVDLVSPEPPPRRPRPAGSDGEATMTTTNSCRVVTIDLCSSSASGRSGAEGDGTSPETLDGGPDRAHRRPLNVLNVEKNAPAGEAPKKMTAAERQRREVAERKAKRLDMKRRRGDFALEEVTVLVSAEALQHDNQVGLRVCEAIKDHGIRYEVKSDLSSVGAPTVFWRARGEMVPCVAVLLDAVEFMDLCDEAQRTRQPVPDLFLGLERKCEGYAVYCVLIGWQRELLYREKKSQSFSPAKYEHKISELAVLTRGLQVHKVSDAREAAEYLGQLSVELARLPYSCSETAAGDFCKKVKTVFGGGRMGCQKRVWINMIHQIPQIGIKTAESISDAFQSFADLMRSYAGAALGTSEKRSLLKGLGGAAGGRAVGPATSNKCYEYFTTTNGDDPI